MPISPKDTFFLKETLRLAQKGAGWVNPNPMVGAVLVKRGKIIGKGFHKKVGFPHAEIESINSANCDIKGAALYVNLEPCVHSGRTPPCTDIIIRAGITRVICATLDPNPIVHGKGIEVLKMAGLDVQVGILEAEARRLNEAFFTFHEKKRPFIALKFAASLDGKIATKTRDSKWITNEKARIFARSLRCLYQAVLVGIGTLLTDNPHLGVRIKGKKEPLRIILDSKLQIPLDGLVLRNNNVMIVTTYKGNQEKKAALTKKGVNILEVDAFTIPLQELMKELYKRDIISILVEGGSKILGSFVDEGLVDKVYAFHAPIIIGGEKAVTAIVGEGINTINQAVKLKAVNFRRFDDNTLTIGYVR